MSTNSDAAFERVSDVFHSAVSDCMRHNRYEFNNVTIAAGIRAVAAAAWDEGRDSLNADFLVPIGEQSPNPYTANALISGEKTVKRVDK